ncbi:hypothetical protein BCL93_103335 [Onishia taeanensis]|uniref:Uncharacterized protein n=1 Tax=Onishia taeanensis TaxID=284577 RepID=A0A328XSW4_9GAMM|nr:hypothetical protein BCL93_103335 [Halomonas taeanensis]
MQRFSMQDDRAVLRSGDRSLSSIHYLSTTYITYHCPPLPIHDQRAFPHRPASIVNNTSPGLTSDGAKIM